MLPLLLLTPTADALWMTLDMVPSEDNLDINPYSDDYLMGQYDGYRHGYLNGTEDAGDLCETETTSTVDAIQATSSEHQQAAFRAGIALGAVGVFAFVLISALLLTIIRLQRKRKKDTE